MSEKQRYPLTWPAGWKRTVHRVRAQFGKWPKQFDAATQTMMTKARSKLSIEDAYDRIEYELKRFGVDLETVIVSTNLKLTLRGLPAGNQGEPGDPGAAVYWIRKGKTESMAIDSYTRVADNLAAIAASLDAMRAIERHGGAQILERAFLGFAQLPERRGRPWRAVFGIHEDINPNPEQLERMYRQRAADLHPDKEAGDHDRMVELNLARDEARRELSQQ